MSLADELYFELVVRMRAVHSRLVEARLALAGGG